MGHYLDSDKNLIIDRCTNVDPLDTATPAGRPVDEPMLESINPAGVFMHADIRHMAAVGNVILAN
jgi:hypothetical protein